MNILGKALLAVTDRPRIRRMMSEGKAGRRLSLRFVAGETLDEALVVSRVVNEAGMGVSLDHLGEHVTDVTEAERARDAYLAAIDVIAAEGIDANISVKLTQLGLGLDDSLALESLRTIAARALDAGTTVTVDMEESALTEATISAYEKVQLESGNLGIAVQAYLYRTADDLERLIPLGGHIRLCKGAYAEPPEVAMQRKGDVDAAFDSLLAVLMASPHTTPAIATHDEQRISLTRYHAAGRDGPWEFQMLYGVRPSLQRELVAAGCPMRIYVPYGDAWYPYLTRRLAERPANVAFFARAAMARR